MFVVVVVVIVVQAPEYDAKLLSALWHKASEVDVGVRVSVSEKLIETLFCQKAENTDGQLAGKSTKVVCVCVCVCVCV